MLCCLLLNLLNKKNSKRDAALLQVFFDGCFRTRPAKPRAKFDIAAKEYRVSVLKLSAAKAAPLYRIHRKRLCKHLTTIHFDICLRCYCVRKIQKSRHLQQNHFFFFDDNFEVLIFELFAVGKGTLRVKRGGTKGR